MLLNIIDMPWEIVRDGYVRQWNFMLFCMPKMLVHLLA
jgi:hypothetical protein